MGKSLQTSKNFYFIDFVSICDIYVDGRVLELTQMANGKWEYYNSFFSEVLYFSLFCSNFETHNANTLKFSAKMDKMSAHLSLENK